MATAIALAPRNCDLDKPVKSISRILQHSILQLCNEHIGYSNKLQILGVLCMTIDDEQQELVVKVNNTLKRVSPALPSRESASQLPSASLSNPVLPESQEYDSSFAEEPNFSETATQGFDEALIESSVNQHLDKKKGRKRLKPVKVQNVYEDIDSEAIEQDNQNVVTVFPTDPDSSQGAFSSDVSSPDISSDLQKSHLQEGLIDGTSSNEGLIEACRKNLYPNGDDEDDGIAMKNEEELSYGKSEYSQDYKLQVKVEQTDSTSRQDREHDQLKISMEDMLADNMESSDSIEDPVSLQVTSANLDCCLPSQVPYISGLTSGHLINAAENDLPSHTSRRYLASPAGRKGNQSSRIKDIILYDNSSPISSQKGGRIEADFMLDQLGLEGRKRRRRAPDDSLTSEEIAEYMGQANDSVSNFKCRFCTAELMGLTKYLQHTLTSHNAYICHQCGKSFTTKSSLLRHRPIHTGMRRFACTICKKTFYRKDKCKAHIKRHLGVGSDQNVDKYQSVEPFVPLD